MRRLSETPDAVTAQIAERVNESVRRKNAIDAAIARARNPDAPVKVLLPDSRLRSPVAVAGTFFMNFWNMKQRGELHESETPAVWAVMMRAIDPSEVVRIVLTWGVNHSGTYTGSFTSAERALINCAAEYSKQATGTLKLQFVSKVRGNLVSCMKNVQNRYGGPALSMLDPGDTELLLRACQTAIEVKQEDEKRWA